MKTVIFLLDCWCNFLEVLLQRPVDYLEGSVGLFLFGFVVIVLGCTIFDLCVKLLTSLIRKGILPNTALLKLKHILSLIMVVLFFPFLLLFTIIACIAVNRKALAKHVQNALCFLKEAYDHSLQRNS